MRIAGPRLQVAVVAASDQVLRRLGIGEREALDVKIESQRRGRLTGEAAQGDQDGAHGAGGIVAPDWRQNLLREGHWGSQQSE